ncbi:MAG: hypothetical protein CMJ94_14370 [Planctomycetes bacterium]|nr:hypothetical protein [Planctomycetota bacterium]
MRDLYARHPRLLILTLLLIVAAGVTALLELPRLEDPKLTPRFAMVYTRFPGATAERVEALVTEPLEDALRGFEELKTLETTSRMGMSVMQLELGDEIAPEAVPRIWSKLRDELNDTAAELPAGASAPEFVDDESEAYTLILGLAWVAEGAPQADKLRRFGEELQHRLRSVAGTEHTRLYGIPDEEILVQLEDETLSGLGLSIPELAAQIRARDAKVPAGRVSGARSELPLEVEGEPESLQAIRAVPIASGMDGRLLRLGEIATVERSERQPQLDQVLIDGTPGIAVAVRMGPGLRIDRWRDAIDSVLAGFEPELPRELQLEEIFAQDRYVAERFSDLQTNLALSMGLVTLVSFLMLGWRSAIFVSIALPLTSLMVLAGMRMLGIPLHQMSVSGLIIALGLLIDNAIIVVDEVRSRLMREPGQRAKVVREAVGMLAVPLFGSTLTTILAFAPLLLMAGPAGEFVGSIAITVSLALVSSLFLSLTVIAALAGRFGSDQPSGLRVAAVDRWYRRGLRGLLARPALAIFLALLLPLFGFQAAGSLTEQFFPPADRDQFQVQLTLPQQASLQQTRATVDEAHALLRAHPEVEAVHWFVGNSAPQFYYNMMVGEEGSPRFAQALVQLRDNQELSTRIRAIQAELDAVFPASLSLALQLEQGPPFAAPIELRLFGPDLDVLAAAGEEARAILAQVPGVTHTRASLQEGLPKIWFRPQEEDLRLSGWNARALAEDLQASLDGVIGGTYMEETEELPIRVRRAAAERQALETLASLELRGEAGQSVPLHALGEFELVPERATITRRAGSRMNAVRGYLDAGLLPAESLAVFEQRLAEAGFQLPPGYSMSWGGEAAERDNAVGSLLANVALLAILMVATLVLSFSSFRAAGVIGGVAMLAAGLGLASLWASGYPFGFMAILGLLGLIGLAINDSIVVLTALREDERAARGELDGVIDVVHHATRHILTTTVTTVAGFLPLILGGSLFWAPLAVIMAGGVLGATLIALVFVPAAHSLLARRACAQATPEASNAICSALNAA